MRQHVDRAERLRNNILGRRRVTERRPIGAGNFAAFNRLFPAYPQFARRLPPCELMNNGVVTLVERAIDMARKIALGRAGLHHGLVQVVLVQLLGPDDDEPGNHAP
jgi:hypothetical protein